MSYTYKFPRPSVTATVIIMRMVGDKLQVLTGIRSDKSDAFPGYRCVPGGFMNPRIDEGDGEPGEVALGETIEDTALREIREETGLEFDPSELILYHVHSNPRTDPRAHVVNVCYKVYVNGEVNPVAGDDLSDIEWMDIDDVYAADNFAFNHKELVVLASVGHQVSETITNAA